MEGAPLPPTSSSVLCSIRPGDHTTFPPVSIVPYIRGIGLP